MELTSASFKSGDRIPSKYTCDGDRFLSPPLEFVNIPEGAKSLVLIMEDPDVPREIREDRLFVHWVLFNIPAGTTELNEGESRGTNGVNTRGEARYTGPCPPLEYEPSEHRYIFTLYAIDKKLELSEGVAKEGVISSIDGHILEKAELIGVYRKTGN